MASNVKIMFDDIYTKLNKIDTAIGEFLVIQMKKHIDKSEFNGIPYEKLKFRDGTPLLNTGSLRDNIRYELLGNHNIRIIDDVEYSSFQQDGFTQIITDKQRSFFWSKYYSTKDVRWKYLACATTFTVPSRKFIGDEEGLSKKIDTMIENIMR